MNILEQIKAMSRYNKNINNVIITILREVSSYSIKFLDTSIWYIAALPNVFGLVLGPSFGLVKASKRTHLIMFDFLSVGQRLPSSDK